MKIDIQERLRPFSHLPGTCVVIPGTEMTAQIFPTRIVIQGKIIDLPLKDPLEGFTVLKDLERGEIRVFGKNFEYFLKKKDTGVWLIFTRSPWGKEERLLMEDASIVHPVAERLFFGCHKAQNMEGMRRRLDLGEILPFLFRLGKWTASSSVRRVGTARLLDACRELIQKRERLGVEKAFPVLFQAGFHGLFCPRLKDDQYQGLIQEEEILESDSPFSLLHEGADLIRSLFIQEEEKQLHLLPCLPPSLHAGRFTGSWVDMEWSKKLLRRLILRPSFDGQMQLAVQSELKRFRLRTNLREKGKVIGKDTPLDLKSGEVYLVDRFEK